MGTFLLLLFIFFIVVPLVKVGIRIYAMRRQWKEFYRAATGQSPRSGGRGFGFSRSRKDGRGPASSAKDGAQRQRGKKIDPDVGEYVAFEEISCNVGNSSKADDAKTSAKFKTEQQIVDVEWEDL